MPPLEYGGQPLAVDHEFKTGRSVTLRMALPIADLVRTGEWDDELVAAFELALEGQLSDAKVMVRLIDAIVMAMLVDPRIVPDDQVDLEQRKYPLSALEEPELHEVVDAAFGGAASAAAFRERAADDAGGGGGADVPGNAVQPAGVPAGKRRGAGGRPAGNSTRRRGRAAAE